jgi:hypothetical protein
MRESIRENIRENMRESIRENIWKNIWENNRENIRGGVYERTVTAVVAAERLSPTNELLQKVNTRQLALILSLFVRVMEIGDTFQILYLSFIWEKYICQSSRNNI